MIDSDYGVLITSISEGSPAEKADLQAGYTTKTFNGREINTGGDIILKIENREVSFMHDITAYAQSQKQVGDKVNFTILRDNETRELDLILGKSPTQPSNGFSNTFPPQYGHSNYPEELYNECVSVAGKSFCDYLFKR